MKPVPKYQIFIFMLLGQLHRHFKKNWKILPNAETGAKGSVSIGRLTNEEARRQIRLSDILVLPSHQEAFPNVVLEGMAQAKPLIVCDVDAMREMIDADKETPCRVSVQPGDVQSLLAGLMALLDNPESWKEMGQRGRKLVETLYSSHVVIRQFEELWRAIKVTNSKFAAKNPS